MTRDPGSVDPRGWANEASPNFYWDVQTYRPIRGVEKGHIHISQRRLSNHSPNHHDDHSKCIFGNKLNENPQKKLELNKLNA